MSLKGRIVSARHLHLELTSLRPDSLTHRARITDNLRDMPFAPSAQIGPVPRESVGTAIGLGNSLRKSEQDIDFEMDGKIDGECAGQSAS